MTTRIWRWALLAICAVCVSAWVFDLHRSLCCATRRGTTVSASGVPFVDRIVVRPGSPAARQGLRSGDLVDLRRLPAQERYRWRYGLAIVGQRFVVPVIDNGVTRELAFTTDERYDPFDGHPDLAFAYAGALWSFLFGALLALRLPHDRAARTLALLLMLTQLGSALAPNNWRTSAVGVDVFAAIVGLLVRSAGLALFVAYAMRFAAPPSRGRQLLAVVTYGAYLLSFATSLAGIVGVLTLRADPFTAWYSADWIARAENTLPFALTLACVGFALSAARGQERARLAWASASLGPLYAVTAFLPYVSSVVPALDAATAHEVGNVAVFVAPLGLTYSVLNRRLLDIGFAVNRAAVFSAVSLVVVGSFVLAEFVLGNWLQGQSHATSLFVSGALALALGLSVHAVHVRVDLAIDRLFFRKRHEDERAIRRFAHEAAYVTQVDVLLARTIEIVERHTDASSVTFALDDGNGSFGEVGENDPAIVALRTWREAVDLHAVTSSLPGEVAYPMIARGRLIGALVLGARRSGESYAPDESDALAELARSVGASADLLLARANDRRDDVILEALRALPDAIAQRLRSEPSWPGR